MSQEKMNADKENKYRQIKSKIEEIDKILASGAGKLNQELSKLGSVSFSCWREAVKLYLEIYRTTIPNAPEIVGLADTLLSVDVELIGSKQESVYETVCGYIRKINGFGGYGSGGIRTSVR